MAAKKVEDIIPRKRKNRFLPGTILLVLGVIFLLNNYGLIDFSIGKLWPIFLIIPGLFMLLERQSEN